MSGFNVGDMFKQFQKDQVQAVPAGTYVLELTKCNVRGENALMPFFRIAEGPMTGQSVLAGQFTLTEKAAGIFFQNLKGCGLNNDFFARSPTLDQIAQALVGRIVQAELTIEQWNGDDRNKIPIGKIKFLRMAGPGSIPGGTADPMATFAGAVAPAAAAPAPPAAPVAGATGSNGAGTPAVVPVEAAPAPAPGTPITGTAPF